METKIKAPSHLKAATRRWYEAVAAEFVMEAHHLRLLQAAAEAWDRAAEARERVQADGPYVTNRFGELRAHPGIAVEHDAKILFARLVRELQLDVPAPDERPPRIVAGRG